MPPSQQLHRPFSLTEEHVQSFVPITGPDREQHITNQEKTWKSLPFPSYNYRHEDINTAANLLSAIAFSDYTLPIPPSTPANHQSPQRKSTRRSLHHATSIAPGTRVAAVHERSDNQWFLATIVRNDGDTYVVRDEDDEEGPKTYNLPGSCIRLLFPVNQFFNPGERVLAVYPDTTTFYPATVLRKRDRQWVVLFDDDDDDDEYRDTVDSNGRVVDPSLILKYDSSSFFTFPLHNELSSAADNNSCLKL